MLIQKFSYNEGEEISSKCNNQNGISNGEVCHWLEIWRYKNSSGKEAKEIHNCTQIQTQKYLLLEPDPGHKEQFPRIIAEAAKI